MKGRYMDIDWRTVQLFLSDDGVAEVQVDSDNHAKVRCTCPSFQNSARCKHSRYVKNAMAANEGHYAILIPEEVSEEEALAAMDDSEAFRQFVIRHARVEVL